MSNIVLHYCSQASSEKELNDRYGKYHILKSVRLDEVTELGAYNNTASLPKMYNRWICNNENITVLAHDDVLIRDSKWIEKLTESLEKYDVVGLAGGRNPTITQPCLWHIMCPQDTHSGRVSHVTEGGKGTFVTNFGKHGRVLILDGLFLAFKTKKIYNSGARFDESNPCIAHFYDIDFSLTCNRHKLKLGTVDIDVVHNSYGLRSYTDEWLSGQAWFMQKVADGKY
jgi:hypothetical protein